MPKPTKLSRRLRHARALLDDAATTDARRQTPSVRSMTHRRPLVPPPGWSELEPHIIERRSSGLKGVEIAAAMGVTPTVLSTLECGRMPVTDNMRERYADALQRCKVALAEYEACNDGGRT